ncbi:DNA-binding transcriptional response regulator, NtrC family, contains REC, AAA-type ATPase, and a Fis-type DNA-binding domains [Massilia sp. PDC64]|nr:sigma-54 dependent transcriptional regulator [Massilia sp. PDC64]SDD49616.1 DNA-binding transcriptional response regulator, NtrC family, contains REC, AAA-type ATPase, and a Fis-type DNA-binding domains [Massilia sp. PDC64]
MRKRLLCIAPDNAHIAALMTGPIHDWDTCCVGNLGDADRALRTERYPVGLLLRARSLLRTTDLDSFLRRHRDTQWIGVFRPHDIDHAACRDLVVEHLVDYHTEPVDPVRLAWTLGHAHGWALLRRPSAPQDDPGLLIGRAEPMVRLRAQVARVARVDAPVLIWGESGSGKELTAQSIHAQSARARGPFVPINCGAIPPNLIQSELFGYERGAFTGAARAKAGLIESAHGGTLFLDEIGDLPKDLQANLLRFLQEKTISRLGSTRAIRVDVRVIAASHVQLQQAVAGGAFREDLYYRLAVLPVTVPALRDRREDVVTLAEHFFRLYADERSPRLTGFSNRAVAALLDHAWPGNVRELINRVRRALVMADGRLVTPQDLGLESPLVMPAALDDIRARTERLALRECLQRSGQNISRAARDLGVSRTTMYRLLSKHGIQP